MSIILILFLGATFAISLITVADLVAYLFDPKRIFSSAFIGSISFLVVAIYPVGYLLLAEASLVNECCGDTAAFSPAHRPTIYGWVGLVIVTYLYSLLRETLLPPLIEVLVNTILLTGFILNFFVGIQIGDLFWFFGNLPIGAVLLLNLLQNHRRIIDQANQNTFANSSFTTKTALNLLRSNYFIKYPILLLLALPLLFIGSSILLLFGQKPSSLVEAFTQTYYHGFSELNHLCENVQCGGHYLCSVAALGHVEVVKPVRYGYRRGGLIICNRQLLVANAFEDLVHRLSPRSHKLIRTQYNKVGTFTHHYYWLFEIKLISDLVYFMMKPLEWLFTIALYTMDTHPEDRIGRQYLNDVDRRALINAAEPTLQSGAPDLRVGDVTAVANTEECRR